MRSMLAAIVLTLPVTAVFAADAPSKGDWPGWRGAGRDGISKETGLLKTWPANGPRLLWRVDGLGGGFSSVAVSGDRIFTLGSQRGGSQLIALDRSDGGRLWAAQVGGGAPNCTPTVDGNRVFALGRAGDLVCADASSGQVLWRKNFTRDFGGRMMSGWGYSESPLIDGNQLACTPGAPDAILAALDKKSGATIWSSPAPPITGRRGRDGAAYSSIVVSNAAGVRQYIQLTGRGIVAVAAKDGRPLWNYNRIANGTANIPTPLVRGDHVFCSSGYGTGSALLKIEKSGNRLSAKQVYFLNGSQLQNHHGGMILLGDHVYCGHGHNQGFPACIELLSGKVAWRPGRGPGRGSAAVLYADGHFYFRYENGLMALVEATPQRYVLKSTFKIASNNGKSWPHPVIAAGRLYLRDQGTLLCYDIRRP